MLNWLIDFSLKHRALVILAAGLFAVAGVFSLQQLDIDAFPDTTPVLIQINTVAPSLSSDRLMVHLVNRVIPARYPLEPQTQSTQMRELPPDRPLLAPIPDS